MATADGKTTLNAEHAERAENRATLKVLTEADTCRKFVVPKLQAAGWDNDPHSIAEQRTITDGRIVPVGKGFVRKPSKKVDYLPRSTSTACGRGSTTAFSLRIACTGCASSTKWT